MPTIMESIASILGKLLPLLTQLQTSSLAGVTTTTTGKISTTTSKITTTSAQVVSTSVIGKASLTSVTSTVPASSVRSTTSSVKPSSSSAPSITSASIVVTTSSTPSTNSALSSISSAVASISPVATDNIPTIENQQPVSSAIPPPPSAPSVNTTDVVSTSTAAPPKPSSAYTLLNNVLILAPDANAALLTETPLDGYGMAWDTLIVPQEGASLPALNSTRSDGSVTCNYNVIVVHAQLSYNYGNSTVDNWKSALTTDQWNALHTYQVMCNVRMVHFNIWPGSDDFGAVAIGGCCNTQDDYGNVTIVASVAAARFPTAGLKAAPLSMDQLYFVPAKITDTNLTQTTAFLQFSSNSQYMDATTGGVINTYPNGRSQMAFFFGFGTWSATCAYMNHIWIHWATHGVYDGYRRAMLSTQIDDVLLDTEAWDTGIAYRTTVADMSTHASWVPNLNARLAKTNAGSNYTVELGLNGNGNLIQANVVDPLEKTCKHDPIWYAKDPDTTPLEFEKDLGTGTDSWPADATNFSIYSLPCFKLDPLAVWLWTAVPARTAFSFVSHTFTHLSLNNATYNDTYREMNWNLQYFKLINLAANNILSLNGIIPPAITGMHNGDALRAMSDNGIWNAVGDNTRPVLRNPNSPYWPLITTVAANGFDGFQITPRFATRVYFNCDTAECTVAEWIATSSGQGNVYNLLQAEKASTSNYLLSLMHDPYMFHQANMRTSVNSTVTIPGTSLTGKYSLLQMWTETQVAEFQRLVNWPLITLKHDDLAISFKNRYLRDQCNTQIRQSIVNGKVVGITVTTDSNICPVEVPVTAPGGVKETGANIRTEQIGSDPATIWVKLTGQAVTLTLKTPVSITGL
ncbi:hypothetical protein ABW20_dc0100351 [Dactylellina cionopaga]|nr:hypothetical protein ABW20_dc0100351 [Dactylellina cionopaga]